LPASAKSSAQRGNGTAATRTGLNDMLTKEDLIEYCLGLPGAYLDRPFRGDAIVLRHTSNRKGFVFLIHAHGKLHINLKCEPMRADFFRQAFSGVVPAFHMNKTHWNSVFPGGDVPDAELLHMVDISYSLTRPRIRGGRQGMDAPNGKQTR
jgi:predicted DNA-binding protein (MmcQ/YjbR family)